MRITEADVGLLRTEAAKLRVEATRRLEALEEARRTYNPIYAAYREAKTEADRAARALEEWDNGGELHRQSVMAALRGTRAGLCRAHKESRYTVTVTVPGGGWRLGRGEQEAIAAENRKVAREVLEQAGYVCTDDPHVPQYLSVRRGPELAAKAREKNGITPETTLGMSGLGEGDNDQPV